MEKDFELTKEEGISSKVPFRIKSGKFLDSYAEVEISDETRKIDYSDIEYICAGVIKDKTISATPPKTGLGKMLNSLFSKDSNKDEDNTPIIKTFYLLDIYVKDQAVPFRINGGFVNYKSFLEKIGYISLENFKMLLKEFAFRAKKSKFNKTACDFLKKSPIKKSYVSELAFLVEASEEREKLDIQQDWDSIFNDETKEVKNTEKDKKVLIAKDTKVAEKIEEIMKTDEKENEIKEDKEVKDKSKKNKRKKR